MNIIIRMDIRVKMREVLQKYWSYLMYKKNSIFFSFCIRIIRENLVDLMICIIKWAIEVLKKSSASEFPIRPYITLFSLNKCTPALD